MPDTPLNFIDRTVCLLLDKRIGERRRILRDFGHHGLVSEFFLVGDGHLKHEEHYDAIDEPDLPTEGDYPAWRKRPNSFNAFKCFKKIIQRAKYDECQNLLLLEDDAIPDACFGTVGVWAYQQMQEADPDWLTLQFGANNKFSKTEKVGVNLLRVNGSGCFHAVLLSARAFPLILDLPMENPIDGVVAKRLHPLGHSYAAYPNCVRTKPGFSYCEGREVDYTEFFNG